jgi:hypothetical protein
MRAPAYRSKRWIKQDWRYLKLQSQKSLFDDDVEITGITFDKRCGSIGGRTEKGRPRLCLPLAVIKKLYTPIQTKTGKKRKLTPSQQKNNNALIEQIRNKLFSNKTKVPWNPIIKKAVNDFQKKDRFVDNPKRRTRLYNIKK